MKNFFNFFSGFYCHLPGRRRIKRYQAENLVNEKETSPPGKKER